MLDSIGWLGAVMFAFCGLPQAIKTYRTKRASDIAWGFVAMWFFGEVFTTAYVIGDNMRAAKPQQWPLLFNYAFNTVIVAYLIYAKFRYDRRSAPS